MDLVLNLAAMFHLSSAWIAVLSLCSDVWWLFLPASGGVLLATAGYLWRRPLAWKLAAAGDGVAGCWSLFLWSQVIRSSAMTHWSPDLQSELTALMLLWVGLFTLSSILVLLRRRVRQIYGLIPPPVPHH